MKKNNLLELQIHKLYGEMDIIIPFDNFHVKILVSENGVGKTTVLKILEAVLSRKYYKLNSFEFESIAVKFKNDLVTIFKSDLENYYILSEKLPPIFNVIEEVLSPFNYQNLLEFTRTLPADKLKDNSLVAYSAKRLNIARDLLVKNLKKYKPDLNDTLSAIDEKLKENLTFDVLYLPTYRRIEDDLTKLGLDDCDLLKLDPVVRSGMRDIHQVLNQYINNLHSILRSLFSIKDISVLLTAFGNILTIRKDSQNDVDYQRFVMNHLGEILSEKPIQQFLKQFNVNNFDFIDDKLKTDEKENILSEKLSEINKIYKSTRKGFTNINNFLNICNKYLIDKQIVHNEKDTIIEIWKGNKKNLESLDELSSGEKQVISLFARLYFEYSLSRPCFLIIDEPENSMSIEWQKELLPDLLNILNCQYIVAATHSPFIFDNLLAMYTVALDEYIWRI